MNFLLLGIDSLIACLAICPMVSPRARLPLAALFGVADGVGFLIGAGLGWKISEGVALDVQTAVFVIVGLNLLFIATSSRRVASWSLWVLPLALTLDNLTYGLGADGSLFQQASEQALSSALLAFAGLTVAAVLPRVLPTAPNRLAGGALLVAAGGLALLG